MPNVRVEDLRLHDGQLVFLQVKGDICVRENEELQAAAQVKQVGLGTLLVSFDREIMWV